MSIVFPYRSNFLAPSKALQELKKKLGPVYFDAKLVECPKNAVELGKLLQKWEELDKQKFKRLSEKSREQRILQNSLSSRHIREQSSVSLLSRPSSTKSFVEISNKNANPPGFRFHANGDPKRDILQIGDDTVVDSNTSIPFSRTSALEARPSSVTDSGATTYKEDDDVSRSELTPTSIRQQTDLEYEEIDYSKEIETLEAIILELEIQLALRPENKDDDMASAKHNYLKAHSQTEDFDSCGRRPLTNYAYDPEQNHKRDRRHLGTASSAPKFMSPIKRSSKCLACQFKLKHVGNEFSKPIKRMNVMKERWNIAPSGIFLASPSTPSLPSSRRESKSLLDDKLLQDYPSATRQPSRTLSRRSTEATLSNTNSRASSKDLDRATSSITFGSSLRRFISPMQRESQMQVLKSQAEQESRDCQNKVDAFLGKTGRKKSAPPKVRWHNN